jgi:thiol-disulfide isomerase/thioredoxin
VPARTPIRRAALLLGLLLLASTGAGAAEVGAPAPDFAGETWLNSEPLSLETERGHPVLVYFWTFGCHNCKAVQPHVKGWYEDYGPQGLQVVAVHAPEFPFERDPDNLRRYVAEHGLTYPVAVDNDFVIWRRYRQRYWPVLYLIDGRGRLRYRHIGEGAYDTTRGWIERLLAEAGGAHEAPLR